MNTVTSNSSSIEGTAFEIPPFSAGARHGCAPASAVSAAEAVDVAGAREVADTATASAGTTQSNPEGAVPPGEAVAARRRSIVSTIRDILDAAEARAVRAEERAREAEAHLALHHRHCICRAGAVAKAIAAEEPDGEAPDPDADTVDAAPEAEATASASGIEAVTTGADAAVMARTSGPAPATVLPSGRASARPRPAATAGLSL